MTRSQLVWKLQTFKRQAFTDDAGGRRSGIIEYRRPRRRDISAHLFGSPETWNIWLNHGKNLHFGNLLFIPRLQGAQRVTMVTSVSRNDVLDPHANHYTLLEVVPIRVTRTGIKLVSLSPTGPGPVLGKSVARGGERSRQSKRAVLSYTRHTIRCITWKTLLIFCFFAPSSSFLKSWNTKNSEWAWWYFIQRFPVIMFIARPHVISVTRDL